jgi:hypothetical protein
MRNIAARTIFLLKTNYKNYKHVNNKVHYEITNEAPNITNR